jgi:hypothetical protein
VIQIKREGRDVAVIAVLANPHDINTYLFLFHEGDKSVRNHRARTISPLPLRVAKTGRNHLNEEFTPLLPTGIGERF